MQFLLIPDRNELAWSGNLFCEYIASYNFKAR